MIEPIVNAVEKILLIALIVQGVELRRVEKPAGIHAVGGNKIPPFLSAIPESESGVRATKRPIGGFGITMRLGVPKP